MTERTGIRVLKAGMENYMKQIKTGNRMAMVFGLCWFVYLCANIGRLSYSAVMAAVIEEGFSRTRCGLVGTGLYICYGGSQILAGFFGDKVNSRKMILTGMLLSALMNVGMGFAGTTGQMLVLWCINGAAQAMLWPPIIRIFSERLQGDFKNKACVHISTTFAMGTLVIYFLAGVLLEPIGYRGVFFLTGGIVAAAGLLFFVGFGRLERVMEKQEESRENKENLVEKKKGWLKPETLALLGILGAALVMQGMLRDGVTSWVPSYLNGVYHEGVQTSTLATMVLPLVNLIGVYAAEFVRKKSGKSEIAISAVLFLTAGAAVGIMICFGKLHIAVAVGAFAVITSCMLGINTMIVNVIPVYFAWTGRIALISGILNSCVYIGSSLALYGIGVVAAYFSWDVLLFILGGTAILGMMMCLLAGVFWKKAQSM